MELLCAIYTNYQKDTENSAKTMEEALKTLNLKYFYKFLFETNDHYEALKIAQDEVRKQYPDPYYWAAWVMLD